MMPMGWTSHFIVLSHFCCLCVLYLLRICTGQCKNALVCLVSTHTLAEERQGYETFHRAVPTILLFLLSSSLPHPFSFYITVDRRLDCIDHYGRT
uniref:Putative secreted protein n=1 Tax=Ixodes ricinus TaxID=34613 RepID=A0A6B0UHQ1_IXORI